ncbi:AAA family ATPase [Streptomyces sp. NPDC088196]|uniref:helix-turn-helix transcriptional regulator n=1 Tax=Streptomyces sp. NPDC088196 TaxID=3154868 RepID=UPI00344CB99B
MYGAGLLGRDRQVRVLYGLLGRLPAGGGALALQGGPGVGKSALLQAAAERARTVGWRLLEVAGGPDDTPFSGLRAVLRPVLGMAGSLPAGQGGILRAALDGGPGPLPETLRVALAAFNLLTAAAAERPVVLIADDVQRLDGPTRDVLAFLARRTDDNPIVVLAAFRTGRPLPGVPVLDVPVLDEPSARQLLARHAATLPPAVRERILGEALGNPLALVELPMAWRPLGAPGSWTHLPVNDALSTAFAAGLGDLPDQARDALLVAAVDQVGDLSEILAAASVLAGRTVAVDVLDSAVGASLIRLDRTTLRFQHPVVRFAVLEAETQSRRQAADAALAQVLAAHPDRRTWHRAQSVNGPDDELADELADAHASLLRRHGVVAAIRALERSAQLTTDSATRGHRLLAAAEHAYGLGRIRLTHSLIEAAEHQQLGAADRAKAWWLRELSDAEPQPGPARTQVPPDIGELTAGDPDLSLDLLLSAALHAHRTAAGPAARAEVVKAAERLTATNDPRHLAALALTEPVRHGRVLTDRLPTRETVWCGPDADGLRSRHLASLALTEPVRHGRALTDRLPSHETVWCGPDADGLRSRHLAALALTEPVRHGRALTDRLPSHETVWCRPDADGLRLLGMAAHEIGDPVRAVDLLGGAAPILREQGRLGLLTETLLTAAADLLLLGDWPRAAQLTEEARRIVAETRQPAMVAALAATDAIAAALRGQAVRAQELADTVAAWQRADLVPTLLLARGLARLGEGRYTEAYDEMRPLLDQSPESLRRQGFAALMPFVVAADRGGDRQAAARILAAVEEVGRVTPAPLLHVQLPYARAVFACDAAAEELYLAALGQDLSRWPLVKARTEHAYGQWLRRHRQAARSRTLLLSARTAFDLVGASDWAGHNTVQGAGHPVPSLAEILSPQETLIAQLAAEGLSNREIAERLYLSHRTVAAHLYRAFPKLGITSRSELAPLLKPPGEGSPTGG